MSHSCFNNQVINNTVKAFIENKLPEGIRYGYGIINKKNLTDICIINNYPGWFDLYTANSHQMTDPVVLKSLSTLGDFVWDEKTAILSDMALPKVMRQARQHHINTGHTFVLHDPVNNLVLLSLFCNSKKQKKKIVSLKETFFYLLAEAHRKLLSLYDDFNTSQKKVNIMLTRRENEVLYWAAAGKTYKETAVISGIHERTVKFHMGNIVKKLGAVNGKHAIKLAADLKLIIDPSLT